MNGTTEKRQRLTTAAAMLAHQKGFSNTTLADIAKLADVPLGGVYYYFRSKDELAQAISDSRLNDIHALLEKIDRLPAPAARLKALINVWVDDRETDALYGCPIGSLCYELAKGRGPLSIAASQLFTTLLEWSEAQFRLFGLTQKNSRMHALHLISALQGISLIANALGDPALILAETKLLKDWLRQISGPSGKGTNARPD